MADDWNLGRLKMYGSLLPHIPDAKFVLRKTPNLLETYHNQYDKLNNKRITRTRNERGLRRLKLSQLFGDASYPDIDVREVSNLTLPGVCESDDDSDEESDFDESEQSSP
jgi:hypothetical protein